MPSGVAFYCDHTPIPAPTLSCQAGTSRRGSLLFFHRQGFLPQLDHIRACWMARRDVFSTINSRYRGQTCILKFRSISTAMVTGHSINSALQWQEKKKISLSQLLLQASLIMESEPLLDFFFSVETLRLNTDSVFTPLEKRALVSFFTCWRTCSPNKGNRLKSHWISSQEGEDRNIEGCYITGRIFTRNPKS